MNSDESMRGMQQQRRPMGHRNQMYNQNYGNSNYGYNQNPNYNGGGQHPRRKMNHFRPNLNDRIVKQNDIIIRLLKEIRDRLPAPPIEEIVQDKAGLYAQDDFERNDTRAQDNEIEYREQDSEGYREEEIAGDEADNQVQDEYEQESREGDRAQ